MAMERLTEREAVAVAKHPVRHDHVGSQASCDLDGAVDAIRLHVAIAADLEYQAIKLTCIGVVVDDEDDGRGHGCEGSSVTQNRFGSYPSRAAASTRISL